MNNFFKYFKAVLAISCFFAVIASFAFTTEKKATNGILKIKFIHTANGKPVILRDSIYTNAFGETYTVSKLKYYVCNVSVNQNKPTEKYYLVNAANDENAIELNLKPGPYHSVDFLLGVDSIDNCSGAQEGALDPMNDMFWTWNSGYVFFKLEGTSASSTADLQRIEHHIGGYKAGNNVATPIHLLLDKNFKIKEGKTTELVIETNLDHYWNNQAKIKISDIAVCMSPGDLAKKLAANFPGLFSIKSVIEIP